MAAYRSFDFRGATRRRRLSRTRATAEALVVQQARYEAAMSFCGDRPTGLTELRGYRATCHESVEVTEDYNFPLSVPLRTRLSCSGPSNNRHRENIDSNGRDASPAYRRRRHGNLRAPVEVPRPAWVPHLGRPRRAGHATPARGRPLQPDSSRPDAPRRKRPDHLPEAAGRKQRA